MATTQRQRRERPTTDEDDDLPARGRPRSASARTAILHAARALLDEVGFARLTMEAIAARAGVSKATVYRRWATKGGVALEAFLAEAFPQASTPDSGSVAGDLQHHARLMTRILFGPRSRTIASIIGAAQAEPDLVEAFRTQWMALRRVVVRRILRRGVERGQARADLDPDVIADALYGPLYFRLLLGAPVSGREAAAFAEIVAEGIRTRPREGAR